MSASNTPPDDFNYAPCIAYCLTNIEARLGADVDTFVRDFLVDLHMEFDLEKLRAFCEASWVKDGAEGFKKLKKSLIDFYELIPTILGPDGKKYNSLLEEIQKVYLPKRKELIEYCMNPTIQKLLEQKQTLAEHDLTPLGCKLSEFEKWRRLRQSAKTNSDPPIVDSAPTGETP